MRARLCVDPQFKRLFCTGGHDCAVAISSLQSDIPAIRLVYNAVIGTCITLTEDASEVIVGSRDGLVMVWSVDALDEVATSTTDSAGMNGRISSMLPRLILPGLPSKVLQVVTSRDLDLIVASTANNQIYLFNLRDGRFVQVIDVTQSVSTPFGLEGKVSKPNYRISQVLTTWTGNLLVAVTSLHASLPNYLFCYDVNGYLLYSRADVRRIHTMCASSDANWLFCASAHNICIFTLPDIRLNTVLSSAKMKIQSICVSSDHRALLAGVNNGTVLCFGLNLRSKDTEDDMPCAVDENEIRYNEEME